EARAPEFVDDPAHRKNLQSSGGRHGPPRVWQGGEDNRTAARSECRTSLPRRPRPRESSDCGGDLAAHGRYRCGVICRTEDRGTGDEYVSPGARDVADVVDLDAAVDLEPDRQPRAVDDLANGCRLAERRLDEGLAAEARIHGHQQNEIEL